MRCTIKAVHILIYPLNTDLRSTQSVTGSSCTRSTKCTAKNGRMLTSAPTETPAIDKGQQADDSSKKDIKVGDTVKVKVNFSASKWATGEYPTIS